MRTISSSLLQQWYAAEYQNPKRMSIYGKAPKALVAFFSRLREDNPRIILELGCGDGRNIIELAKEGHVVVGVDLISKKIVQERAKKNKVKATYFKADITKYPFEKKRYGAIISSEVFHLMKRADVVKTIKRMKKATNKDGLIYISILSNIKRRFIHNRVSFQYAGQAYYSVSESRKLLQKEFKEWEIIKFGKFHDEQDWPLKAGKHPIPKYHWSGDYVYIIAKKNY